MNIDGLGNKQIKLFFKRGIVTKYSDIFKLYEKKDELKSYDGFGELSVNKLLSNINKAKLVNFDKFLTSLGIKQVGENTSRILAEHYINLPNLIDHVITSKDAGASKPSKKIFDLVFIDADKENYIHYYEDAIQLVKKNGLIIIDNVLWHGEVADDSKQDKYTNIIRSFNQLIKKDNRVQKNIIPIGDGLTICVKN